MDVLAFRFFNVFGSHQPAGHAYAPVVPAFVSAALDGRPLPIHGAGDQTRDFSTASATRPGTSPYGGSVVSVLTDAVARPDRRVTAPEPVNLTFGTRTSLLGPITVLEELLGRPLERQHGGPRAGDLRDSQTDAARLRSLFPDLDPVPLVEGIRATVAWFRDQRRDQ